MRTQHNKFTRATKKIMMVLSFMLLGLSQQQCQDSVLDRAVISPGDVPPVTTPPGDLGLAFIKSFESSEKPELIMANDILSRIQYNSSERTNRKSLNKADWRKTEFMTVIGNKCYVVQNETLHEVDQSSGKYRVIDSEWGGFRGMATAGDGYLYVVSSGGCLYRVNPDTGVLSKKLGNGCPWKKTKLMTGGKNASGKYELYIATTGDVLYLVDRLKGTSTVVPNNVKFGPDWTNITGLAYGEGILFVSFNGHIAATHANGEPHRTGFHTYGINPGPIAYTNDGMVWSKKDYPDGTSDLFVVRGAAIGYPAPGNEPKKVNATPIPTPDVMAGF